MQTQAPGAVAVAQQLQKAGLLLLDTRPWEIFRYSSLPGSINIPVERASHILYRLPTDKKTPLLVYGGDGGSSSAFDASKVCEGLEALGFVDVVNGGSVEFVERLHQSRFESVTVDRGYPRAVRGDGSGRSQRGQLQKSSGSSKSPKGSEDFLNALSGVLAGALEEGQEGGIRSSVGGLKVAVAQSRSSKARGEGGLRTFGRSTVPPTLGAQLDDELNEQIGRCLRSLTETALTAGISMTRYQPAFGALVELVNARERRGLRYSAREVFEAFSRGLQTVLSSERNRRLLETSFADLIEELARGALVLPRPV